MKTEKIEFYVKYDWYGYEGVGYCKSQYTSDNVKDCLEFIKNCSKFTHISTNSRRNSEDDEPYSEIYDKYFHWESNGFFDGFESTVYKRVTTEEKANIELELKKEERDSKINQIIN